jgi:glycolate oxidase iron-sulfur subunit
MQTNLADFIKGTKTGNEIESILRSCVHCGFCNATCPTYAIENNELDGPRGRIYLIKKFVETGTVTDSVQMHLDRCLTCLSCTTTCPSGVKYNRLIEMGRELVDQRIERPLGQVFVRWLLRTILPYSSRFSVAMRLGRLFKPILPEVLSEKIPQPQVLIEPVVALQSRKILVLDGCAQPTLTPMTNRAAEHVFNQLGIELIRGENAGCCGAVNQHLMQPVEAAVFMRNNIDAWWPHIQAGAEAVMVTASGCGVMVKDYGWHLRNDPVYKVKAEKISALCKDPVEILANEDLSVLKLKDHRRIAFQSPCTLQHGQKLKGQVEKILSTAGFDLVEVIDEHLCCGSAGTYSVLQEKLSKKLRHSKLENLQRENPALIATANVGCQTHLDSAAAVPVVHWLELLAGFK